MSSMSESDSTIARLTGFISSRLDRSGMDGYVVGLSGGIDSAVSAALAVAAVGPKKVLGVMMPYRLSSDSSLNDALQLIEKLGIEYEKLDISPMIDAYYPEMDSSTRLRAGNKMARERMSILFDVAYRDNFLVLGTGNRTEICLGYTTWYGDSACSINPIGELYKTEVRQVASALGVPDVIINKAPSADLWAGQTDEGEIGVTYDEIDRLLVKIIDLGEISRARLEADGIRPADLDRVLELLNRNSFKRSLPEVAELGKPPIPAQITLEA